VRLTVKLDDIAAETSATLVIVSATAIIFASSESSVTAVPGAIIPTVYIAWLVFWLYWLQ